uniref:Uncharacterized protein n=1 Tax=Arundo donax TaxID=35708 RepID=A0A0A8YLL7_ARUDO
MTMITWRIHFTASEVIEDVKIQKKKK